MGTCAKVWPNKFFSENKLLFFILLARFIQTKCIVMMIEEGFNFMTPRAGIFVLVKMHYFFRNLLFFTQAYMLIRQIENIVTMTKEEFTKIVN